MLIIGCEAKSLINFYLPMNRNVVFDMVDDFDEQIVTFSGVYRRPGISAIHGNNGFGRAKPGDILPHHLFVVD